MPAKRSSLAAALSEASGREVPQAGSMAAAAPAAGAQGRDTLSSPAGTAPSRVGKKAVTGHFDPVVSRQLKQLALDRQTTVQALLAEALNDLFEKHGRSPLA